jgi:tetratricopeptide (TPR) repeat protein
MTKSLEDYKKELALYPAAFQRVYPAILDVQLTLGQRKDAEYSLRAWSKSDPVAPYPVARLLAMLIEDGDAKTAVAEGEAALQRLPAEGKTDSVHLALGKAYLLAGDKQKGAATLKALLEESHDAEMLNNAAYELGDAGLELPLAESSTRKALEKLTEESNSWTLDEDVQTLRTKTREIAATWDTLGWILFHEGKLEEAQSYLQAGWQGELNLATGKHLGDLQAARGNKAAAITTYELAIASEPGYNALGVRTEPSAAHKALQSKVDAMHAGGVKSSMASVGLRLQELRKVQLGPSNGRSGNAEYRMLLKGGKAVKAEPTGDKTVAGADEMVARANFASFFPVGSEMSLVKVGYVNCHQAVCELMLQ